uniref:CCHC-type domain-containing protein n=1 Tax=Panagrolaimus superbus TaxID=310955 RepID=A0A914Z0G6_9BILA
MDGMRHRAGLNNKDYCTLLHRNAITEYNEVLQALIDDDDDLLSGGVILDVPRYAALYHRILTGLRPLMELVELLIVPVVMSDDMMLQHVLVQQTGHSGDQYGNAVVCYRCNGTGHMKRDCPN